MQYFLLFDLVGFPFFAFALFRNLSHKKRMNKPFLVFEGGLTMGFSSTRYRFTLHSWYGEIETTDAIPFYCMCCVS